jgi:hypothetical protein
MCDHHVRIGLLPFQHVKIFLMLDYSSLFANTFVKASIAW